ncbi:MAG: hypothetical protein KDH96_06580 [Candidatus Riesia sp.]|nr:hypothetical protein [Candidatus Riesia sp.]
MDSKKSGTMTKKELKKILSKHYKITHGGSMNVERELFISKTVGCYHFTLQGTPPKGYGLYIPERRRLWLYDAIGKRFKDYYLRNGMNIEEWD